MQNIKNINEVTSKITRLANIKERLEKHMLDPSSSASAKSLSIDYYNNITTTLRSSYDNKDKSIISKGIEAMVEEIDNCINSYQEELKIYLKNSNMKQTKFGNVFNILYTPHGIPESLRRQLQTRTPAMSSPNEDTQQYDVKILAEDYKKDPSFYSDKEEREFIQFLLENDIDYIEI